MSDYANPNYWNERTPLFAGMPWLFHLYQNLNDNKVRVSLSKLEKPVLDVGCGDGRFLSYASVGVDFSRGMLDRAKRKYLKKPLVRASAAALPFKTQAFNSAFMVDVLLHIPAFEQKQVLNELNRVANKASVVEPKDRTAIGSVLQLFRNVSSRTIWHFIPYITICLSFLQDRFMKLK